MTRLGTPWMCRMMFDVEPERFWNVGEKRGNQLVFIGKELDEAGMLSPRRLIVASVTQ